jgi:hypothetical protein
MLRSSLALSFNSGAEASMKKRRRSYTFDLFIAYATGSCDDVRQPVQ